MNYKLNSKRWIVLFGGKNRENIISHLVENGIEIVAIYTPKDNHDILDILRELLVEKEIPIIELNKDNLERQLSYIEKCNLLCIGFPMKLSNIILRQFELCLNIHPTLLPKYRGVNSGAYVIQNSEKYAGSSVHLLTENIDQGPILMQSKIPLSKFDTTKSMQRKVYATEPSLVLKSIRQLEKGAQFSVQNEIDSSFYAKRNPNDSELDPNRSLLELFNFIRSCDPEKYPAFFRMEGQRVFIKMWTEDRIKDDLWEL
jgi:methionyl-tRNA formyltransferase